MNSGHVLTSLLKHGEILKHIEQMRFPQAQTLLWEKQIYSGYIYLCLCLYLYIQLVVKETHVRVQVAIDRMQQNLDVFEMVLVK